MLAKLLNIVGDIRASVERVDKLPDESSKLGWIIHKSVISCVESCVASHGGESWFTTK